MNLETLLTPETQLRLAVFFAILGLLMLGEGVLPRRRAPMRATRWPVNLGLGAINMLVLALAPITAVGAALFSIFNQFGALLWLEVPLWPAIIIALLILDLAIYGQHRLLHAIPLAWRMHRMHHTDVEFDVTTALRFHPFEIIISILIKAAVIVLIAAPLLAVIAFEIILNAAAMFNHSNLKLPKWADSLLRCAIVTPDMHRVHHTTCAQQYNANYGFNLSIWDRLFGSYVAQPKGRHADMQLGQPNYREPQEARLDKVLTQPFRQSRGCATACVSAEQWHRKWIGIDLSPRAQTLVVERLEDEIGEVITEPIARNDVPRRTDMGKIKRYDAPENKRYMYGEQKGLCNGCKLWLPYTNLDVDHVVAKSKGGTDHIGNLQLLCGNCNNVKGNRSMEYLVAKLKERKLR